MSGRKVDELTSPKGKKFMDLEDLGAVLQNARKRKAFLNEINFSTLKEIEKDSEEMNVNEGLLKILKALPNQVSTL